MAQSISILNVLCLVTASILCIVSLSLGAYAWSLNNAFSLPIPTSFLALVTLYAPVQIIVILICQIVSSLAAKREAHLQIHNDVEDEARHDGHRWLAPFRPSGSDVTGSNGIIRHLPKRDGRPSHLSQMPVLPTILVNLHTAVSSVLLVQGIKIARSHPSISNSPFLCAMSSQWQSLFAARNRQAISMIEQTLQCCGFRTVRDRAWPWTDVQAGVGPDACVRQLGFTTPCFEGWGGEYGNVGGLCIAAVGVGWFAAFLLMIRPRSPPASWSEGLFPTGDADGNHLRNGGNTASTSRRQIEDGRADPERAGPERYSDLADRENHDRSGDETPRVSASVADEGEEDLLIDHDDD